MGAGSSFIRGRGRSNGAGDAVPLAAGFDPAIHIVVGFQSHGGNWRDAGAQTGKRRDGYCRTGGTGGKTGGFGQHDQLDGPLPGTER